MKILITGASGFIGKHLKQMIHRCGQFSLLCYQGDLNEIAHFDQRSDLVVHLAAIGRDRPDKTYSESDYYQVNYLGTKNVLEYCHKFQAKLIFFSTAAVYTQRVSPYQRSKVMAEEYLSSRASKWQIPCVILRLFNPYGYNQTQQYLVPYLVETCLRNQPVTLNNPESVRDFIDVQDVVTATIELIKKIGPLSIQSSIENLIQIFDLGSAQGISIRDLAEKIKQISGSRSPLIMNPHGDNEISIADISPIKHYLQWRPQMPLDQGLRRMIENE